MSSNVYAVTIKDSGTPGFRFREDWKLWGNYRHRENGPAIVHYDGREEWWLDGIEYSKEAFDKYMNPSSKKMTVEEIQKELGYKIEIVETSPQNKCDEHGVRYR
jgi:hypothetical protein